MANRTLEAGLTHSATEVAERCGDAVNHGFSLPLQTTVLGTVFVHGIATKQPSSNPYIKMSGAYSTKAKGRIFTPANKTCTVVAPQPEACNNPPYCVNTTTTTTTTTPGNQDEINPLLKKMGVGLINASNATDGSGGEGEAGEDDEVGDDLVVVQQNGSLATGARTTDAADTGGGGDGSMPMVAAVAACVVLALVVVVVVVVRRRSTQGRGRGTSMSKGQEAQFVNVVTSKARAEFFQQFRVVFSEEHAAAYSGGGEGGEGEGAVYTTAGHDAAFAAAEVGRKAVKLGNRVVHGSIEAHVGTLSSKAHAGAKQAVFTKTADYLNIESSKDLLIEAHLLLATRHPNILGLAAVTSKSPPFVLCTEYPSNGDLQAWLRACRPMLAAPRYKLTQRDLYDIVVQIAGALEFLLSKELLHTSPAATSVFVGEGGPGDVKLGDAGSVVSVSADGAGTPGRASRFPPGRWRAPELVRGLARRGEPGPVYETIVDEAGGGGEAAVVATPETMIWAFGVFVWEVSSLGRNPWGSASDGEVATATLRSERLQKASFCPEPMHRIMHRIWNDDPGSVPHHAPSPLLRRQNGVASSFPRARGPRARAAREHDLAAAVKKLHPMPILFCILFFLFLRRQAAP